MDWAEDRYDANLISDTKKVFRMLFVFLPVPLFWALEGQTSSRWNQQGMDLDGAIGALGTLRADQMYVLNPLFVAILAPMCDIILYPVLKKASLLTTPLQKMGCGMLLAVLSYIVAGTIQWHIQANMSAIKRAAPFGDGSYRIINTHQCSISVHNAENETESVTILPGSLSQYFRTPILNRLTAKAACQPTIQVNFSNNLPQNASYTFVVALNRRKVEIIQLVDNCESLSRLALVRFVDILFTVNGSISIKMNKTVTIDMLYLNNSRYVPITPKTYDIQVLKNGLTKILRKNNLTFRSGLCYTVIIQGSFEEKTISLVQFDDTPPREKIHLLWQIPQHLILALAEVMISVQGLNFAYSQSPSSMKSCLVAVYMIAVAFGHLLVIVVASSRLTKNLATEFFVFAGLTIIVTAIFCLTAHFYKYSEDGENSSNASDKSREEGEGERGRHNVTYEPDSEIQ